MIELIIAIVVMALSLMTIPLMLSQNANNNAFSAMQESILAARTKMGNILTYDWDKNSRTVGAKVFIRVLDTTNCDSELRRDIASVDTNRRKGQIPEDYRRRLYDGNMTSLTIPANDGLDANKTSLNHFNTEVSTFNSPSSSADYIFQDLNMTSMIYYVSDTATYSNQIISDFDFDLASKTAVTTPGFSTNIKMVELTVQNSFSPTFTFRAFSSNIGQTELLSLDTVDIP
jgi:hypothetical protein